MNWWPFGKTRQAVAELQKLFQILKTQGDKNTMDLSKLKPVVDKVAKDFVQLRTDFDSYVKANPPSTQAQQDTVDAMTTTLTALDTGFQDMDAALQPAVDATAGTATGDTSKTS